MRISNNMIYGTTMQHMQTSLASFMESTIQGGTQKKINRPSDDPAGTALVLNTRTEIAATEQYERNLGTAKSWLTTTDATLQEVSATLIAIEKLAEQASTNTVSAENRTQIAYELEQLFGQLINLSNVEVENNSIVGGHNYQETAFEEGMTVTSWDTDFDPSTTRVSGAADKSMAIRFTGSDLDPPTDPPTGTIGSDELKYQWTSDGGITWSDDVTLSATETQITQNGVTIDFRPGSEIKIAQDTSTDNVDSEDGTFLYLYPTAVYNGDDQDPSAYANIEGDIDGLEVTVHSDIKENVLFRLTNDVDLRVAGSDVNYQFSHDGGVSWEDGTVKVPNPANNIVQLPIDDANGDPAGYIELNTQNASSGKISSGFADMGAGSVDGLEITVPEGMPDNVLFRLTDDVDLNDITTPATVNYQLSTDGGANWAPDTTPPSSYSAIVTTAGTVDLPLVDAGGNPLVDVNGNPLADVKLDMTNAADGNISSGFAEVTTGNVAGLEVTAPADLTENVLFRLTSNVDLNDATNPAEIGYQLSYDGGVNWETQPLIANPGSGTVQLPLVDDHANNIGNMELDMTNAANGKLSANLTIDLQPRIVDMQPRMMDLQPRRVDMLNGPTDISLNAQGIFSQNIAVRIDNDPSVDLATPGEVVNYSYSTDKGQTWIQASSVVPSPAGSTTLTVPGGFLTLNNQFGGSTELKAGDQMLIHPDRAELGYEVMENTYIPVNQVGKDIFGGMYNGETVEGDNIFDTVGKLIAYCEHNDTDGIGESLVSLKASHEHMLTQLAKVGGLDNRLDLAADMLSHEKLDQGERLSNTEDIDLTELLNKLAKDELTYSTVLQASSMILQLNFTKFI